MNFIVQIARNIKQIKENNMEREIKFLPAYDEKSPWIPVTERLPKCEEEVYIQTKNGTMTTAVYEYGTMPN